LSWLSWRRGLLLALVLVVAAAGVLVAVDVVSSRGVVHRGVLVWGESAAGADAAALNEQLARRGASELQRAIAVKGAAASYLLVPANAGVQLNKEETVRLALARGREGSVWQHVLDRVRLWRHREEVDPVFTVDEASWQSAADELELTFEKLPQDARLSLDGEKTKVVPGSDGASLDRDALKALVLEALRTGATEMAVPLRRLPPAVTTAQAQAAVLPAKVVFSSPLILGYRGKTYRLSPQDLVGVTKLDSAGVAKGQPVAFQTDAARKLLEQLLKGVEVPAVDAVVTAGSDGRSISVTPSKEGIAIEWNSLLATLRRVSLEPDHRYVPIPTTATTPKLTTADAKALGKTREVASFETYFSPTNTARAHNIQQVAALLDGHVVKPGEVFSFNHAVGPTTRAAGFDEAPIIVGGALQPGVGGGICQVSTTLFNAVFFAGLPVVERKPHSFFIDHYPIGRDATVSQGEVDFKFRNDTDQLLVINAAATDHSVRVSLAAPNAWDRTVAYRLLPAHDYVAPHSTAQNPRRLRDPSLAPGTVSALEPGIEGRTVRIERTVTRKDGKPLFADAFDSVYAPKDYIIRVGPPA
jgi:vancomycin resistance protein YoaR